MRLLSLALGAALMTACVAVANDKAETSKDVVQTYDFSGFDRIDVSAVHKIEIRQGRQFSVRTEARAEDARWSDVRMEGDTLKIGRKKSYSRDRKDYNDEGESINVFITMPRLLEVDTSGVTSGTISGFEGDDLDIDTSGVSKLVFRGSCEALNIDTSGVSEIRAKDLRCASVDADTSGVSKIWVQATDKIDADASGMSRIWVTGNPSERSQDRSGNAKIIFE